jgi:hypothetical protein
LAIWKEAGVLEASLGLVIRGEQRKELLGIGSQSLHGELREECLIRRPEDPQRQALVIAQLGHQLAMTLERWIVLRIALDEILQAGLCFGGHRIERRICCRRVSACQAIDIVRRHRTRLEGRLERIQLLGSDRGIGERPGRELPCESP